jgi:hypothetical protein
MLKGKKIIVVIIFVILFSIGLWLKRFIEIDKCIDLGGRWDYETGECVNTME